ncbi:hypothetical protein [Clostridium perfringens]|uniref:hypothetical protein n=1 Tax=Clostridium perfringens TaxID=1502 RepID=UPI0024BCE961|nr:hypothetical protein [Clostridium perfringens]CAJ1760750.1 hypothetical protein AUSP0115_00044 [uncultured phage]
MRGKKKTHEEFIHEIKNKYGDEYIVLGEYISAKTKILVKHNCGYTWKVVPNNLLREHNCPNCSKVARKTHEEFVQEVKEKYGDEYEVLGEYKNANTKILVRHNCNKCKNHEWEIKSDNLLNKNSVCPVCSNKKVVLGINTIWDTDRWMVNLGVSEEDAKRYCHNNCKKITVKCPNCGREKKIRINDMYKRKSISCSCGDGKSYPEKFITSVLEQLDLDFEIEYKPNWIENKRYDFRLKNIDCIIETHGEQHYNGGFKSYGGRTLEEEQANDKIKREIALNNGIKHYIELDCRKSEMDYIKNSILNSELNDLFDLSNIDWTNCAEFANKNIVKEVCSYWNNKSKSTIKIGEKFNIHCGTVVNYLKRGTRLGWCDYNAKEEVRKCSKKIEIFKNNKSLGIFKSCVELERKSEELFGVKLRQSAISLVCNNKQKNHKGFIFKYVK